MIYFTSDLHFSHKNIIKFCNRPFNSAQEMDEQLINNWNSIISPNDEVYNLGDFVFGDPNIVNKLNGKIYLIKGNHEKKALKIQKRFEWIHNYYELKINKQIYCLFHYPIASWNRKHYGTIHLYGHCHGKFPDDGTKRLDVGVDAVANRLDGSPESYRPISIEEVYEEMKKRPINKWDELKMKLQEKNNDSSC